MVEPIWTAIKESPEIFSLAGAIVLATVGYVAKHVSDVRVRRYDARLAFITARLRDLYGPLYVLSTGNDKTWTEFRKAFRPGLPMVDPDNPLAPHEKAEYVRWLENAFIPCNDKMRRVIEGNAHLFIEGKVPEVILELLAHFDELRVVLSRLKDGTDDNVFPNAQYPKDFSTYIRRDYDIVVNTHAAMTAQRR